MAGRIELVLAGISIADPLVKSGRLKSLGSTRRKPTAVMPEVRSIAEQGMPYFESSTCYGNLAPAGTPQAILARLNSELVQIAGSMNVRDRFASQNGEARSLTHKQIPR